MAMRGRTPEETPFDSSDSLATEYLDGSYKLDQIQQCRLDLPIDRNPQASRFRQFLIFSNPQQKGPDEPEYLVLQLFKLFMTPRKQEHKKAQVQANLKPMAEAMVANFENAGILTVENLPDANKGEIQLVRNVSAEKKIPGYAANLPDDKVRKLYGNWQKELRNKQFADALKGMKPLGLFGFDFSYLLKFDDLAAAMQGALSELYLPDAYTPLDDPNPHFALCITYDQIWQQVGYSRGELINTLSLAPGEQLTLEVHSWDKSTIKSEEELADETELRVSQNITQRDVMSVVREMSKERKSGFDLKLDIPIKKIPIKLGLDISRKTTENVDQTLEQTRELTVQASNVLKVSRKTRIEISREVGRENKQTRTIANTNRCHSLNCHYFEIMSNYLVTTRLASIKPCLLLAYPKMDITSQWILSYEDVLKQVLLDKVFLPGFDGARILEQNGVLVELRKKQIKAFPDTALTQELQEELATYIRDIVSSYQTLLDGVEKVKDAASSFACLIAAGDSGAFGLATCVVLTAGEAVLREMLYIAVLSANRTAVNALKKLEKDGKEESDVLASTALRKFFASVSSADYRVSIVNASIAKAHEELGISEGLVNALIGWGLLDLIPDDSGLHNSVKAAADRLEELVEASATTPSTGQTTTAPPEGYSLTQISEAKVSFEQLKSHIENNWPHYMQTIWSQEHADQRLMRLQACGSVALIIDNELLGFYGRKGAFPLNDLDAVKQWVDYQKTIDDVMESNSETEARPQLVTLPTQGTILETMVGACDACEIFIQESRTLDLRNQEAKTEQEELEAERRRLRLGAQPPELSDPDTTSGDVTINVKTNEAEKKNV